MSNAGLFSKLWTRMMLRGTSFTGSYKKLRGLYLQEDPWGMSSAREQHRFEQTNLQLQSIKPKFDSILELGCGEGHQSMHLSKLTTDLTGIDVSGKAVERAKLRCPDSNFHMAALEDLNEIVGTKPHDLITACEVLYYLPDIPLALEQLQSRCENLYVSNYIERYKKMEGLFEGDGWTRLEDVSHGDTVWINHIWRKQG